MTTLKTSVWVAFGAAAFLSYQVCASAQSATASLDGSSLMSTPAASTLPPKPPQVTCGATDLTIVANGSTVGSIFNAIDSCLGIKIVVPDGLEATRMYASLGPGPARSVLESFLASSDYDYVLRASAARPERIEAVMLMAKTVDSQDKSADFEGGVPATPEGLVITPARALWLESLKANRHSSGAAEEETPSISEPTLPAPAEITGTDETGKQPISDAATEKPGTTPVPAPADSSQAANNHASAAEKTGVAPNDDPAAADSAAAPPPSKEVQNKINSMEQLFEQRKQMMESQIPTPKPQ